MKRGKGWEDVRRVWICRFLMFHNGDLVYTDEDGISSGNTLFT